MPDGEEPCLGERPVRSDADVRKALLQDQSAFWSFDDVDKINVSISHLLDLRGQRFPCCSIRLLRYVR